MTNHPHALEPYTPHNWRGCGIVFATLVQLCKMISPSSTLAQFKGSIISHIFIYVSSQVLNVDLIVSRYGEDTQKKNTIQCGFPLQHLQINSPSLVLCNSLGGFSGLLLFFPFGNPYKSFIIHYANAKNKHFFFWPGPRRGLP